VFFNKTYKDNFSGYKKLVSVALGSYNRLDFLKLTIDSIRQEVKDLSHEIIVVDGGSSDGTLQWLVGQKDIITIVQHNRGEWLGKKIERRSWGYFMNLAFKCAQGKFVCMLSDDCLVVPGAIVNGIKLFEQQIEQGERIGAMAFYWRDWSTEEHYHVNLTLGDKIYVNHGLYLNSALKEVAYIDEDNFFFYNGDGDLCLKLWHAGYKCIKSDDSFIEHYPHANVNVRKSNYALFRSDLNNYLKKWDGIFYDKLQDNRGGGILKYYTDSEKTGELFLNMHRCILKEYPEVLRTKSNYKRVKDYFYWKRRALVRKIRTFTGI